MALIRFAIMIEGRRTRYVISLGSPSLPNVVMRRMRITDVRLRTRFLNVDTKANTNRLVIIIYMAAPTRT